ncbi:glycosyltransferase [Hirschia litorea]|uniref:Glycosyltransferase n=1 Tax=Hirschia litorea TaxID=1199156 RepID=A0ABW2IKS2_9PROT
MEQHYPSISVVMEWENAKLSDADRSIEMLTKVSTQLAELQQYFTSTPEILILFDAAEIDKNALQDFVDAAWNSDAHVNMRLEAAPDLTYYDQKNFGAKLATNQLLIFIDSDVVPEADWLKQLLTAKRSSNAAIVGGQTYIEPTRLYEKAFALIWFFPLRSNATKTYESERFFANNFAIDRQTFLDHAFPENDLIRGRCYVLAKKMNQLGLGVEICPAARVSHPPPNGGLHFLRRAIVAGHDSKLMADILNENQGHALLRMSASRAKWNLSHAFKNIKSESHNIGLGFGGRLFASTLAITYYGIAAIGELISSFAPKYLRKNLKV